MIARLFFVVELENLLATCSTLDAVLMPVTSARSSSRRNPTWRLISSLILNLKWSAVSVELFSSAISISKTTRSASIRWSSLRLMISHLLSVAKLPYHHRLQLQQLHHLQLQLLTKATSIRLHSTASCHKSCWAMHPMIASNFNCFFLIFNLFSLLCPFFDDDFVILVITFYYTCYQQLHIWIIKIKLLWKT